MSSSFEYGTFERLWDMFKTMHHKEAIPEPAYTVFDLIGVRSTAEREVVMRKIALVAYCCSNVEAFEQYLTYHKLPPKMHRRPEYDFEVRFSLKPMTHLMISSWARG